MLELGTSRRRLDLDLGRHDDIDIGGIPPSFGVCACRAYELSRVVGGIGTLKRGIGYEGGERTNGTLGVLTNEHTGGVKRGVMRFFGNGQ